MQTILTDYNYKKQINNKPLHTKCPLCGGKIKILGQVLTCKKCNFVGTEKELIEKTKSLLFNKTETTKTLQPVIFYCSENSHIAVKKTKSFGYNAYDSIFELLSEIEKEQRVYLVYDNTVSDEKFFNCANQIFSKTQNVLALLVPSQKIIETKDPNQLFKEAIFSAYENMLFQLTPLIKKLEAKKQNQIIDSFLLMSCHIKNPEVHFFVLDRLLESSFAEITNSIFK